MNCFFEKILKYLERFKLSAYQYCKFLYNCSSRKAVYYTDITKEKFTYVVDNKVIFTVISVLLAIGLVFWLSSNKTKDFGLNFFTEMLGVAITVLVINKFIEKKEMKKAIPQRLAAYGDISLFISRYVGFWVEAYRLSVPADDPDTIEQFFSDAGMTKILNNLYMVSKAEVTPSTEYWKLLITTTDGFINKGSQILNRHAYNLDPKAYKCIHQITESRFNESLTMIQVIRTSVKEEKRPVVDILANYSLKPKNEDFKAVLDLIQWCNSEYSTLKKYDSSIRKNQEYTPLKNKKNQPKCMIPKDIRENQERKAQPDFKNNIIG